MSQRNPNNGSNKNGREERKKEEERGRQLGPKRTGKVSDDDDTVDLWTEFERTIHINKSYIDKFIGMERSDSEFFTTMNKLSQKT